MHAIFKQDFWALSREQIGYYSFAQRERWRLSRAVRRSNRRCPGCDDPDARELVTSLFNDGLGFHPLVDLVFEGIARAEIRFSLKYIPQHSHEERLTGNLVSEIDAAIFMIRESFLEASSKLYGQPCEVDFLYLDLSQGGTIEKDTGADLAIVLNVDLPDQPRMIRSAAFQAKKINGSTSIPKEQYATLVKEFRESAEYLFYDMNRKTLLPPMVRHAAAFEDKANKDEDTESFSVSLDDVDDGLPLSLWLFTKLAQGQTGQREDDFNSAINRFRRQSQNNGRLALLSIGRPISSRINSDGGLDVYIPSNQSL